MANSEQREGLLDSGFSVIIKIQNTVTSCWEVTEGIGPNPSAFSAMGLAVKK